MKKEIILCDNCGKELKDMEKIKIGFDMYYLDVCDECRDLIKNAREEIKKLEEEFDENKKRIIVRYGLNFYNAEEE